MATIKSSYENATGPQDDAAFQQYVQQMSQKLQTLTGPAHDAAVHEGYKVIKQYAMNNPKSMIAAKVLSTIHDVAPAYRGFKPGN